MGEDRALVGAGDHLKRAIGLVDILEHQAERQHVVIGVRVERPVLMPFDGLAAARRLGVELGCLEHRVRPEQAREDLGHPRILQRIPIDRIELVRQLDARQSRVVGAMTGIQVEAMIAFRNDTGLVHECGRRTPHGSELLGAVRAVVYCKPICCNDTPQKTAGTRASNPPPRTTRASPGSGRHQRTTNSTGINSALPSKKRMALKRKRPHVRHTGTLGRKGQAPDKRRQQQQGVGGERARACGGGGVMSGPGWALRPPRWHHIQVQADHLAGAIAKIATRGDHGGIVGTQRNGRAQQRHREGLGQALAQQQIGRHPPSQGHLRHAIRLGGGDGLEHQRVYHGL